MKTASIHSCLTMPQRLRAMILAFGRADQEELGRLAASSPDGNRAVSRVAHQFFRLTHLAVLHNGLLLDPCAVWLMGQTLHPGDMDSLSAAESRAIEVSRSQSLAEAASVEAAFTGRITAAGISPPDWRSFRERFLGGGAKYLLRVFLSKAAGLEDSGLVAQYHDAIDGFLFRDHA